ncbi:Trypsin-like peptidase domain-containing protein [Salinibacillus kushneri]|uniref:Trypsin-like peptidase domain-containing protein n=1 Tax=Salinibacillus kushneri TaxID=237682 RepID=A0A1I0I8A0_9BACI|nr:trypsin-like peptidase domain-containing protein [Salinibacillus kushneri]SET92975.1 Trypsin-like peptidase domain-containing protein [Salinibacillus kushneri]
MKNKHLFWPIIITVTITLCVTILMYLYYQNWDEESIEHENKVASLVRADEESKTTLKTIIHEAQKSVVQIEAESESGKNIGSGFVYNNKGDIMTNAHVVENADSVYVKTSDARTYPAAIIGLGSEEDVAVLRVPQLVDGKTLSLNPNFEPEIGDEIIAVGSPLGFQNTVTTGIISGKNRSFSVDEQYNYQGLYQISAPITNGNSGGPLIHRQSGEIIAINSAGSNEGQIGFSLPIHQVIDQVKMWSDKADDEELQYDGAIKAQDTPDEDQFIQDATYIVNYFYENIEMRDYLNAYKLLGMNGQRQTSYQDFRNEYVHIHDLSITNISPEVQPNQRVKITLNADHVSRDEHQVKITEHYESTFIIGYENDQLKILEKNQELLSTTEQESSPAEDTQEENKDESQS